MIIAPNDTNLVYSPFNWLVTGGAAKTINAGAYCRALIAGTPTTIALTFDVDDLVAPLPTIAYRVDNGPIVTVEIAATIVLPIPTDSTWAMHLVEWWVQATTETQNRWNATATAVVFTGLDCTDGTPETAPMPPRALSILALGDSITEGVRTLQHTAAADVDRNASQFGWAFPLAQLLPAEVGVVGFGRQGWTVTGNGGVPVLGDSWPWLWSGVPRPTDPDPDVVLINMGTNDSTTDTVAAQVAAYEAMLTAFPTSRIVAMRPFGGRQAANIEAAVAMVDDARLTYLDTTGWWDTDDSSDGLHPYGYVNQVITAPRIAGYVLDMLAAEAPVIESDRFIWAGDTWVSV